MRRLLQKGLHLGTYAYMCSDVMEQGHAWNEGRAHEEVISCKPWRPDPYPPHVWQEANEDVRHPGK